MKYNWSTLSSRERDALVAEKVMGLEHNYSTCKWCNNPETDRYNPHYSNYTTDIKAAWEVVEKIKSKYDFNMGFSTISKNYTTNFSTVMKDNIGHAPTAPEAICLAALRAVGVDV